jgi:hypothetical protein
MQIRSGTMQTTCPSTSATRVSFWNRVRSVDVPSNEVNRAWPRANPSTVRRSTSATLPVNSTRRCV